jgi:hypothetical protein
MFYFYLYIYIYIYETSIHIYIYIYIYICPPCWRHGRNGKVKYVGPKTEGCRPSIAFCIGGDGEPTWCVFANLASSRHETMIGSKKSSYHMTFVRIFWMFSKVCLSSFGRLRVYILVLNMLMRIAMKFCVDPYTHYWFSSLGWSK